MFFDSYLPTRKTIDMAALRTFTAATDSKRGHYNLMLESQNNAVTFLKAL